MSNKKQVMQKLDNLIASVSNLPTSDNPQEQKKNIPEQPSNAYDLLKPYRIVVSDDNHGGPEKLKIENFELNSISKLADNELLIEVFASGVNFIDTYHRSGLYPNVTHIGKEGSGKVIKVGKKVSDYKMGDKVCWFSIQGSYATHVVTTDDCKSLMKMPPQIAQAFANNESEMYNIAASIGIQALTAHYLCRSTFVVGHTSSVLIHAGAGGTGGILVQICKKVLKAKLVICTVGSEKKKKLALSFGADHCILYKNEDFSERVMALTDNEGVDVVFDGVGKATAMKSMEATKCRGTCIFFGNASGAVPAIDPLLLCKNGSIFITRPTLRHYAKTKGEINERYNELFEWIQKKILLINIGQTYKLHNAWKAHTDLEQRQTVGKIILNK